ncbi:hypothetical protein Nepgr_001160 [Nepenthes gracilis]|uniref:Pentatricopeptide repeat-containing protein n=1 Tax=Nepenthes gracilis TaxID=150966 RepID=A0AAD3P3X9_NEPGR|nr:hypothetical protein Nepgr_001160 [Nepenthes gracilis]
MSSPLSKFFTQNCPNVEAILDSENLSDGFLLTDQDQNKAPVLVPVPPLQGLNNSNPAALVVDHNSYAVTTNKGGHTLLAPDDFVQPDAILENKKIDAPVQFRGSLSLFSGFALQAGAQKFGSSISFGKSGNAPIMVAHERLGYISLSLSRQIPLWALEKNSDPPPQNQLGWWCIHATINSSSLEDHIGCKASTGTDEDGGNVSWCLVDMYAKCGEIKCAEEVFNEITDGNVVSWTFLIAGYVQNDCVEESVIVFNRMRDGMVAEADLVSWTAMIVGYTQLGHPSKALKLLVNKRWIGILPNSVTTASVLTASAPLGHLNMGKIVHCLGTATASSWMDKQGRKSLLITSFSGMAASILMLYLSFTWKARGDHHRNVCKDTCLKDTE